MSVPLEKSLNDERFLKDPFLSYKIDYSSPHLKPNETYKLTYAEEYSYKIKPDNTISYVLNNYGHRCDDFSKLDPKKENTLFAGCSSTFGDSLPDQYRWAKILYNDLKNENAGDFHCLSFLGAGADKIVINILKYCQEFGNPDRIFVMYSDFTRQSRFLESVGSFATTIRVNYETFPPSLKDTHEAYDLFTQTVNYMKILEMYCESHGIELYTSLWDSVTMFYLLNLDFKNLKVAPLDKERLVIQSLDLSSIPKKDQKYIVHGRDGKHGGIAIQILIKDFFLNWLSEYKDTAV
jgi:hypothetical protein